MRSLLVLGMITLLAPVVRAQETQAYYHVPNMMGDHISLPQGLMSRPRPFDFDAMVGVASGASRTLASRNNIVSPVSRIYFDYSFSDRTRFDSASDVRQGDIHLGILGAEKAFFDDLFSLEIRLPFVSGFDGAQSALVGTPAERGSAFGNMYLGGKLLLHRDQNNILTAGCGFTLPTGTSTEYVFQGNQIANVDNETGFVQPFVAYSRSNGRWFLQSWTALDFAVGGNELSLSGIPQGLYQEQNLFLQDLQLGCWIYQNRRSDAFIKGFAPLLELHYASTVNDTDSVSLGGVQNYRNPFNRLDLLNTTIGSQIDLGRFSTLRLGAAIPFRNGQLDEADIYDVTLFAQWDLARR